MPNPALFAFAVVPHAIEQKILAVGHNNRHRPQWELPGGKVEQGEDPEAAAIREVREETKFNLSNRHLVEVAVFSEKVRDTVRRRTVFVVLPDHCNTGAETVLGPEEAHQKEVREAAFVSPDQIRPATFCAVDREYERAKERAIKLIMRWALSPGKIKTQYMFWSSETEETMCMIELII